MLVRLYPRRWRERYGDELSQLLEDRPPGPFDALDLLLGAFDAYVNRRYFGTRTAVRAKTGHSRQLGASSAIVGGGLWIPTLALAARDDPAMVDLVMLLVSLTLSMFVVALAALSAVHGRSHRLLVWASFLLPAIGVALLAGGLVTEVAVGDRPLVGELTPYAFWMAGLVLALTGSLLFGVISAATGGLTGRPAVLLSIGAIVQLVTIFATDHATQEWLMLAGAVIFGLSWVLVGVGASRVDRIRVIDQAA